MGIRLVAFGVAMAIIAGCSTSVVPVDRAVSAPSERVIQRQEPSPELGRLIVVRDSGIMGSLCLATVFIDGARMARLETKEKAEFFLAPGEHLLGASLEGKGLCGMNARRMEREVLISQGQTKVYRIYTSETGMDMLPTSDTGQ